MTGRIVLALCTCFALAGLTSAQVPPRQTKQTTSKSPKVATTAPPKEGGSITEMASLLADNNGFLDKKKISDYSKAINKEMGYDVISEEDLEFPSVDLYGVESWHSDAVNPFIGSIRADVPDSFVVDLTQFVYPLDELKRVTSKFGYRRRFRRMHYGIDISVRVGDTIRAAFDGKVRMVDYDGRGYGRYVVVRHTNGLETLYAHNSRILAKEDQVVRAGDPIALGGNTGRSTGPHLHFECRYLGQALNPEKLINFYTGVPQSSEYLVLAKNYNGGNGKARISRSSGNRGDGVKMHRVRRGDTLAEIAKRYGTTVSKICKLNRISARTTLKVGRSLRVG
ncbi:M23 family metallopeptidase [Porphyromonas levii]|uniref:M23 family metallopeptidase n=1 Tax=Porphyromonas levii TaxID=28114 RepID=UPI00036F742B|nr:M23 family metallopeptidase [Porphyromonas levii]